MYGRPMPCDLWMVMAHLWGVVVAVMVVEEGR
jgi:hypothetical protein